MLALPRYVQSQRGFAIKRRYNLFTKKRKLMEKEFIKTGNIKTGGINIETNVKIILHHSGIEYFIKKRGYRHFFSCEENAKRVICQMKQKKKLYKTSGQWYIKEWYFETIRDTGEKTWWLVNNNDAILNKVDNKEDIQLLLNEEPIIEDVYIPQYSCLTIFGQ